VHGSWSLTTVMAARASFLPGIVLLFLAFILSLLVAVSLPALPALDVVRCHFVTDDFFTDARTKEIRVKTFYSSTHHLADFYWIFIGLSSLSAVRCLVSKPLGPL
jgi:hypothetical protein